jgi:mono/diheme cytochrome c family protein
MLRSLAAVVGLVIILISYVMLALPDVGPPPDLKVERTEPRIARGAYLANHVAVCMDCHSKRDFNEYAGPIIPGTLGQGGEVSKYWQ